MVRDLSGICRRRVRTRQERRLAVGDVVFLRVHQAALLEVPADRQVESKEEPQVTVGRRHGEGAPVQLDDRVSDCRVREGSASAAQRTRNIDHDNNLY